MPAIDTAPTQAAPVAAAPVADDAAHPVLQAYNVTVIVRGKSLVDDATVDCASGEVVGVIGPNGAGKSTLLKTMAGITRPTRGQITLHGRPVASMSSASRSRYIAYAPQSAAVHPFTAIDMVLMGRYPYLRRFQLEDSEDRDAARAALADTDTLEFADRKVDTLSGGERQRVMLARVLAQETDVILADEPVASLDIKHQLLTLALLRERARKHQVAVVVVMHDLNLAATYCDKLVAMHEAKTIATGTPAEVLTTDLIRQVFQVEARVTVSEDDGAIIDKIRLT